MLSLCSAVNFLNPQHRIIYALAFGAFTSQFIGLLQLTFQSSTIFDEKYTDTFLKCEYMEFGYGCIEHFHNCLYLTHTHVYVTDIQIYIHV